MLNRVLVVFLFGLCAASLALHFTVESQLGILEDFSARLVQAESDFHSEDNFTLCGSSQPVHSQPVVQAMLQPQWREISLPLAPILQPPKSF